ncbi:hypothetical protein [Amycolatopsis suaedae]|uniref:Uncharacterized protein n=1 Tax=Amycolatopsis suaedae TaxID=2510978 RepID=A0A4Q7J902_9PSEU|nr:hypothetical protein [Amycolatopsis suaedae]RZQ64211.1 hypothetical protein EWH70_09515 [Amycolatopsis suaedae]
MATIQLLAFVVSQNTPTEGVEMSHPKVSRQVEQAFRLSEDVVSTGQYVDGVYPDGLTEAVIDALIAEVDAKLDATERVALVRVDRSFTDARRAGRAARRAARELLRRRAVDVAASAPMPGEAA